MKASRTPLSDYVNAYLERTQITRHQLSKRSVDPENPRNVIYPQWLEALQGARAPAPELWRLRALAAGTNTSLDQLKQMAAKQWLEYDVAEVLSDGELLMIAVPRSLSEEKRRRIKRLAEAMAREEAAADE
ncbi:hypothetical protein [Spongiactinospora sp. TRM90649]|uniref:hypothetical protein n=1 Tax=Spongiactinospora sp. TRM90649 TaxID=3031114 RepID=UPI0023F7210F|nr:hypothetical protein [Spongiactinospora sp. TRM90649]MDF5758557.1 hypothetical protein [Spongiactinospora sp. TRM90649]